MSLKEQIKREVLDVLEMAGEIIDETKVISYTTPREKRMSVFALSTIIQNQIRIAKKLP